MKKISIIIPAYNEEEALPALMERITKFADDTKDYDFEFLFVNDGSKDDSEEILKELNKRLTFLLDVGLRIFKFSKTGSEHYQAEKHKE